MFERCHVFLLSVVDVGAPTGFRYDDGLLSLPSLSVGGLEDVGRLFLRDPSAFAEHPSRVLVDLGHLVDDVPLDGFRSSSMPLDDIVKGFQKGRKRGRIDAVEIVHGNRTNAMSTFEPGTLDGFTVRLAWLSSAVFGNPIVTSQTSKVFSALSR